MPVPEGRRSWAQTVGGAVAAGAVLVAATFAVPPALAETAEPAEPELAFRLQDAALNESSGLAVSARHRGIVWTHNDGGSVAQVHALDRDGRTAATVTLRGIDPFDPEALAPGVAQDGSPMLFLGDIGDNERVRRDVSVFRFPEPRRISDLTMPADWLRFRYPDGPHDAEALLVDPRDGRLWIATKDLLQGGLYRAPRRLSTTEPNALERVSDVPGLITDGAFLPDGRFLLRSYRAAYLYQSPERLLASVELPPQEQGESMAVDGDQLLIGSEGVNAPVYAVPVPRAPRDDPASASATPSGTPRSNARSQAPNQARNQTAETRFPREVAVLGAALAGLVAVLAGARRRRHPR